MLREWRRKSRQAKSWTVERQGEQVFGWAQRVFEEVGVGLSLQAQLQGLVHFWYR